jgi:osmotically-inducible protein OsmY
MRHYQSRLALLAGCAAIAIVSAQQPLPAPPLEPPAAPESTGKPDVSDAQLGLEIQARLFQTLDVRNLSALVRFGVATLDGMVRTEADRQRAEQIALEIAGVERVVNELTVADDVVIALETESNKIVERASVEAEDAVTQRLHTDAVLGSRDIKVDADGLTNTVTLTGTVSTEEEKERAGQLAVSAFPAGQVRNQLEVRQRL